MIRKEVKCVDCGFLGFQKGIPFETPHRTPEERKLLKDLGYYDNIECKQWQRDDIANGDIRQNLTGSGLAFLCSRHVWWEWDLGTESNEIEEALRDILNLERKCPYFFAYQAGFTPTEHKELLRDAKSEGLLIKGMIWAAVVGGVIGALVSPLVSSLVSGQ